MTARRIRFPVRPAEHTTGRCRHCDIAVTWTEQWGGFWMARHGTTNTARAWCQQRPDGCWHNTTDFPYP